MHNTEVVHYFYNMPLRNVLALLMRKLRRAKRGLDLQGYWEPQVSSCKHRSQKAKLLYQLIQSEYLLKNHPSVHNSSTNAIWEAVPL